MDETAPNNPQFPQGGNMSAERPQPFDEAQVARAVEQVRREEELREKTGKPVGVPVGAWEAGHVESMLGGPPDPGALGGIPEDYAEIQRIQAELGIKSQELDVLGIERIRQEREGTLRYYEGSLVPEALRRAYEPRLVIDAVRRYMARYERHLQMPDMYRAAQIRDHLEDRAEIFQIAQNPGEIWKPQLEEWKLIDTQESLPSYTKKLERYELRLATEEDKNRFSEAFPEFAQRVKEEKRGGWVIMLNNQSMGRVQDSDAGKELLAKRIQTTVPGIVPKEKLPELAEACEKEAREVWVRHRFFVAAVLYNGTASLVDQVCKLFEDRRYSELTSQEWKDLFSLGPTKEGERDFGKKIEAVMRINEFIGVGGGPGVPPGTLEEEVERLNRPENAREKERLAIATARGRIEAEMKDLRWVNRWLQELGLTRRRFLNQVAPMAARNRFTAGSPYEDGGRDKEWYEEIKSVIRGVIGGDEADTKAAVELGERVFYMWGMATHWDGKESRNATVGWPGSDDRMKLEHFETWRRRERGGDDPVNPHDYGPDATMGKYDQLAKECKVLGGEFSTALPFLRWALPTKKGSSDLKVGEMRSFYERWWNKGTEMKDLPWDTMRTYAWWYYNLSLYFAGGYGAERGKHLLGILTKDDWKREELFNKENMRDYIRTVHYAVGGWLITKGEIGRWLASLPQDEKGEAQNLTASDFEKRYVDPLRRGIRKNLLVGALATPYESKPLIDAGMEWAIFYPGGRAGFRSLMTGEPKLDSDKIYYLNSVYAAMDRVLRESGYGVPLEQIKEEVREYLENKQINTG